MANRIKGITVEIGGDTTKLSKALEGVNKNIKNTQTQLKDVEKLLKLDPTNTELLSQKQKLLADAVSSTSDKLETLKKASEQAAKTKYNYDAWKAKYDPIKQKIGETETKLKDLKEQSKTADEQLSKGEISQEKYDALQREIKETSDELTSLKESAKAVSDEFGNPISPQQYDSLQREIVETQQELQNLQREAENSRTALVKIGEAGATIEKVGDKISGAGEKLLPLTAGITALGTMAVKTTADFDAVMSKVSAVSGATGEDLDALRAKAREMDAQTKFSASEAGEAQDNKIMKYKGNEIYFYYPEYFKEQCMPDFKSSASALPELVKKVFNIDDEYLLCFLAQLCTFFIPDINNPILVLNGGQGTSKFTTSKKIKALVDPANLDVTTMPDKEDGLFSVLLSSYLVAFDNVDRISSTFSDILCTNCTGGNAGKRKLYSDNDLIQIKLHTNVILNGIGESVKKSDLAERCNTIYLEQIRHRATERKVWSEFESLKPQILGSIFNTLKIGLTLVDDMSEELTELPRMADFAIYGASFIKAMGLDYKEFVAQYTHNTATLLGERADADDFVILIKCEFDRKNQSNRHKKPFCILGAEQTEGFLGRKE